MYSVSNDFKNAIKGNVITTAVRLTFPNYVKDGRIVVIENDEITEDGIHISDYSSDNGQLLGLATSKEIEFDIINTNDYDLSNRVFDLELGVLLSDNTYEYVPYGRYIVMSYEDTKSNNRYSVVANDLMVRLNRTFSRTDNSDSLVILETENYKEIILEDGNDKYLAIEDKEFVVTLPITLKNFYKKLMEYFGLEIENQTLINSNFTITAMPDLTSYSVRAVLGYIAELFGGFAKINRNNKCEIYVLNKTQSVQETITSSEMNSKLVLNEKYGPVNVVSIGLSNVEGENVTMQDTTSIADYGETTIKIEDNPFVYTEELREQVIVALFNQLKGFEYYPFECGSKSLLYTDALDKISLQDVKSSDYVTTYILNQDVYVPKTLSGKLESPAITNEEQKYKYISKTKQAQSRTEIIVDKANGQIQSIVEEIGDRSQKTTTITQDIDGIESRVEDIEDLTDTISGIDPITLTNCREGNLLELHIKGNNTVFHHQYPNDDLYPSDDLYPFEGSSFLEIYTKNKLLTAHDEWTPKISSLDTNLYTGARFTFAGSSSGVHPYVYNDSTEKFYYMSCEPNTKYRVEIESGLNSTFGMAAFESDVFQKLSNNQSIDTYEGFSTNVSYDTTFVYDTTKKVFEIITGSDDAYIFVTYNNEVLKNFVLYKVEEYTFNALLSPLTEIDKDYSYYASIKGSEGFYIYDALYYDENKSLIAKYSTFFNTKILKGLEDVAIITPVNTKYLQLELRQIYGDDSYGEFAEYDIAKIKPMLEKVTKFVGNNTYSGQLWNNCIQMEQFYNSEYYVFTIANIGYATEHTAIELECYELESSKTNSALFGCNNGEFAFYSSRNNDYHSKLFQYNGQDYAINTVSDFLNVKYKFSFKYDEDSESNILKLEDENGYSEEFAIPSTTAFTSTGTIKLFVDESATECNIYLYSFKVYDNTELIENWVPVYYKLSGKKGLANIISQSGVSWGFISGTRYPQVANIIEFVAPETDFQFYNYQKIDLGVTRALRQSGLVYDEYVIENGKGYELRRILDNGVIIENPEPTNIKDIEALLVEGTNYIDIVDYTTNVTAKWVVKSELTNFFATKIDVTSQIIQSSNEIKLSVMEEVTDENYLKRATIESSIDLGILDDEGYIKMKTNKFSWTSNNSSLTTDGVLTITKANIANWEINDDILGYFVQYTAGGTKYPMIRN